MDMIQKAYECSLADCTQAPAKACKAWPCTASKKKDESPMNSYASATVIAQDTTERDQRHFLTGALYDAYTTAKTALKRKFGLIDDVEPLTVADVVKRIQDGLFVIPEKYKDTKTCGNIAYLRWRDPKVVEDKDGFEAAKLPLKKAYNDAERAIRILAPADGLKALQDFEAAQAAS